MSKEELAVLSEQSIKSLDAICRTNDTDLLLRTQKIVNKHYVALLAGQRNRERAIERHQRMLCQELADLASKAAARPGVA